MAKRRQRNKNMAKVSLCVKYTMVFMNIAFFILGGPLWFGIWGVYSKDISTITSVIEGGGTVIVDPLRVFITIGCIVVALSSVGCIGALRENTTLLNVFRYSMILILLLEVTAGVLGYFYRDEVIGSIENVVNRSMINYHDDPDTQFIIDTIQDYLQCCGINEPEDWEVNKYYDCDGIAIVTKCGVPFSCCLETEGVVNDQCGNGALGLSTSEQNQIIYTKGCKEVVATWLTTHLILISIVIVGSMILLEIVSLQLSVSLIGDIKFIKAHW